VPTSINFDKKLGFINGTSIVLPTSTEQPFLDTTSWFGDGIDDQLLSTSNFKSIDNGTQFSWSFWFKLDTIVPNQTLIRLNTDTSTRGFHVYFAGGASLQLEAFVEGSSANWTRSGSGSVKQINKWYHVCVTLDNTLSNRYTRLKIYLDGVQQGISNFNTANMGRGTNLSFLANIDGSLPMNGNLNEVACWGQGTVLTASQVLEIFNQGLANDLNNLPTTPQPTNWWRSETASWNGFAWTLTDVNGSFEMRSQNMLEANREDDVPSLYSNKSFSFDGVDDIFETNSIYSQLNGGTKLTLSVWIKPISGSPLLEYIISNPRDTTANNSQFALVLYEGIDISFNVESRTSQYVSGNINAITYGDLNHILVCVDLSRTIGTEGAIFINGVDETTTSAMGILSSFYTATDVLHIGIDANGGFNRYNGYLDEVAIWSGQDLRDSTSVQTIFNQGVPNNLNENGLIAPTTYYRMGEDATWNGTNWTLPDNGSGGNNGTSQNMALASRTNDVPLFNTKSILFDGVDDYIDCGNAPYLQNLTDFSVSLWAKQTTATTQKCFITDWIYNNNGNFAIQTANVLGSTTKLNFAIRELGGTPRVITTINYPFIENVWNHIVVTFSSGNANIYVNGISESFTGATLPTSLAYGNGKLDIGRFNGLGRYFNGNIDEVAIFNSELSASDVISIFNNGVPQSLESLNPISWWRMGDFDSYPTLIDRGSGNNNGTMTNTTNASIVDDVPNK